MAALRLEFDRGTLLCRGTPAGIDPERLPGMMWDARVGCWRAPAWLHERIVAAAGRGDGLEDAAPAFLQARGRVEEPDLRPYQAAALAAWMSAGRRGVIVLPTGSGKTRVAVAALAQLGCPALCLVPTRILLEQWHGVLCRQLGGPIGRYGDGLRELAAITVATFESAFRHMCDLGNRFQLLVVDEAHHFGDGGRDEALEMSLAPWRLGLTATPARGAAEVHLAELLGPTVFELTIADLAGSFLAEFELVELRLELTAGERAEYERCWTAFTEALDRFRQLAPGGSWSDFTRWAMRSAKGREAVVAWRSAVQLLALTQAKGQVIGTLLQRYADSRVLVFTSTKEAAYRIAKDHLIMPITADIKRGEREAMLADFQAGRIRALVSSRVLNEGVDVPDADVGIVAAGSHGAREYVQRVGRVLRPAPGKHAVVYDLVTRGTVEVGQARRKRRGLELRRAGPV